MKTKIHVPPIKIQGIKTKLVFWIQENVVLEKNSQWIEPFMGSGVVGFNLASQKALFADTNPHTIAFYNQLKTGEITAQIVKEFLEAEGKFLFEKGQEHYNFVRSRFNETQNPLDFLFLNRSCFNGMIRFNKKLKFNVPYGHKPKRFAKAYITKIVNQVKYLETKFAQNDWEFKCQSFEESIVEAQEQDFIYCDPPYIGRHVDYYDSWNETNELTLHKLLTQSKAKFLLSTWDNNEYRRNEYLDTIWKDCYKLNKEHFYHLGAKESNRKPMIEALISNYDFGKIEKKETEKPQILTLFGNESIKAKPFKISQTAKNIIDFALLSEIEENLEKFDYTEWQANFFTKNESVKSFSQKAMEYRRSLEG